MNPEDLRVDVFIQGRARSFVRVTHIPTGYVVESGEHKTQLRNRVECLKVLASLLGEPDPDPEPPADLVLLRLVPVEVFGVEHYGLADAVQAWSDCNRARGHLFRVDDQDPQYRRPGETIQIYVAAADVEKLTTVNWEDYESDAP